MKNSEEYNKEYYEKNKARISTYLKAKEKCPNCDRCVAHQNMLSHQKSTLCKRNSKPNPLQNINYEHLLKYLATLQTL